MYKTVVDLAKKPPRVFNYFMGIESNQILILHPRYSLAVILWVSIFTHGLQSSPANPQKVWILTAKSTFRKLIGVCVFEKVSRVLLLGGDN